MPRLTPIAAAPANDRIYASANGAKTPLRRKPSRGAFRPLRTAFLLAALRQLFAKALRLQVLRRNLAIFDFPATAHIAPQEPPS
jgi:hypothetical protein